MTIVLLQLFSRNTPRWIKVTDCGTSHWASHAMSLSLSLSLSLPPFFFISLSLFISSLSLLVAFVLHPGVDGPAGAQTEMMTPWAGGWWVERASSLASIGFLKLSETKAHFRTAAAHLPFWDSPRVDIFTEQKQIYRGLQSNGPRSHPDHGFSIQCFVKAQNKWSWQSICFQKEMQRTSLGPETDETADSWALTVAQKSDWILRSS